MSKATEIRLQTSRGLTDAARHCPHCDSRLEAHTDKVTACTVCTRYKSLVSNAKKERRDGSHPGCGLSLDVFAAWFAGQRRVCAYCDIPEELVALLDIRTQVGHRLQRLGVDRLSAERGYEPDNMVLACFACNKAKSNTFDTTEMSLIGEGIGRSWERRLANAAVATTWRRCPLAARRRYH